MVGFSSSIPIEKFRNVKIEAVAVGASSLRFVLEKERAIMIDYYGGVNNRSDWLYNLPLCGENSVQSLVGESVTVVEVLSPATAVIKLSNGRDLIIEHDDIRFELMRFIIGDEEYIV